MPIYPRPPIRPVIVLAIAALLAAATSALSGCSSNPRADFANAQAAFNGTVQTLVANRDQFSDQEWGDTILPLINAGDTALDQYDVLTAAGLSAESATATLRQVLIALSKFLN